MQFISLIESAGAGHLRRSCFRADLGSEGWLKRRIFFLSLVAKLHAIKAELRRRMDTATAPVGDSPDKVVMGCYRYHALPGNLDRLCVFGQLLRRLWRLVIAVKCGMLPWDRLKQIFARCISVPASFIRTRWTASPPLIHGGSRMHKGAGTLCSAVDQQWPPNATMRPAAFTRWLIP